MKARYSILSVLGALLLIIAGSVAWLLESESGARAAIRIAVAFMGGKLTVGSVDGRIAGPLSLNNIHYRDPEGGVEATIEHVGVDARLSELLSRRAHVLAAEVRGAQIDLGPSHKPQGNTPFSLAPPLDILLDSAMIERVVVHKDAGTLIDIRRAQAAGQWTSAGIVVQTLVVDASQGHVSLQGRVSGQQGYAGEATGSFDWRLSDQTIAGSLTAKSNAKQVHTSISLSSPVRAQLAAVVEQAKSFPWSLHVDLPEFDPRTSLVKAGSISRLSAVLDSHGDLSNAELNGNVGINGEHALIDPLRISFTDPVLTIAALNVRRAGNPGELNVHGTVRFDQKPFTADVNASWAGVDLPQAWVGQRLLTQGDIEAHGNVETFAVKGGVKLGPPGRLADLAVDVSGTPQQIEIRQASIVQSAGQLAARGTVTLKPSVGWQLSADAKSFDPGAFLAQWPGKLGFALTTQGQMADGKPSGRLQLSGLAGTLRNRRIAGSADLTLESSATLAGNLNLKSGNSTINVTGNHGNALDGTARIEVASLDDWVPDTRGRISATVHATGRWPSLDVSADVNGQQLSYASTSVQAATITARVHDLKHPWGTMRTRLTDVVAQDFHFAQIVLEADGSQASHTAHLRAEGDPLTAEVRIQGAMPTHEWTGSVTQLAISQKGVASLALQQPMQVHYADPEFSVSESCLAGDGINICFGAQRSAAREIKADYRIEHLPLALVMALAEPGLPFSVTGTLQGHGNARQAPDGSLFGTAALSSDSGEISETGTGGASLLKYQQFELAGELAGETATGTTQAQLGSQGRLEGRVALAGLTSAAPSINANGSLSIPDLTPITLFVPQLANVHGAAEGKVTANGPMRSPQLQGQLRVASFSAEVPRIGLKLHDGEITGSVGEGNALKLDGHIGSGTGTLALAGASGANQTLQLKISGKDFLFADIPGARVIIAPDLDFSRAKDRMDLSGSVTIPEASIDLTKLPQGQQQRAASPDVVVVDDKNAGAEKSTPLYANVKVTLGDKVKLTGFGLDATLAGELGVQEVPGQDAIGAGEIRLAGKYKAYGQDLTIQDGRLLYANQSLVNPQLIITAVRVINSNTTAPVTAKLTVTGTAMRPQLDVSADPAMSQTQALSYLVAGKSLDTLGSGEGNAVQSAARSVGGAAGNLLAKNIGKRLGIDTIGIESSDEIGGSAFTIGQYLSPRLYVSYGVGLFEPGQVITLKYKLSDRMALEASQGPQNQRAGINYRVER